MANSLGGFCWRLLGQDEDGQLVVDVASGSIAARMREHTSDVLAAVTSNVQGQLKRHEDEGRYRDRKALPVVTAPLDPAPLDQAVGAGNLGDAGCRPCPAQSALDFCNLKGLGTVE